METTARANRGMQWAAYAARAAHALAMLLLVCASLLTAVGRMLAGERRGGGAQALEASEQQQQHPHEESNAIAPGNPEDFQGEEDSPEWSDGPSSSDDDETRDLRQQLRQVLQDHGTGIRRRPESEQAGHLDNERDGPREDEGWLHALRANINMELSAREEEQRHLSSPSLRCACGRSGCLHRTDDEMLVKAKLASRRRRLNEHNVFDLNTD